MSALLEFIASGDDAGVQQVLSGPKSDPNVADPDGNTALMYAVNLNQFGAATLLLRAGADANARNQLGCDP
jgi:ankyrin repeat protein